MYFLLDKLTSEYDQMAFFFRLMPCLVMHDAVPNDKKIIGLKRSGRGRVVRAMDL